LHVDSPERHGLATSIVEAAVQAPTTGMATTCERLPPDDTHKVRSESEGSAVGELAPSRVRL
jgi:hypothetical protein